MSIRIGILGYGNLGRGVESAIRQNPDLVRIALPVLRRLQNQRKAGGGLQLPIGPRVQ